MNLCDPRRTVSVPAGWGPISAQHLMYRDDRGRWNHHIAVRGVPEDPACRDLPPAERGPGLLTVEEARALHSVLSQALADVDQPRYPPLKDIPS